MSTELEEAPEVETEELTAAPTAAKPKPLVNTTWSGKRTQPCRYTKSGVYAFPATGASVELALKQSGKGGSYCCEITADGVTVRRLDTVHGFRGFSARLLKRLTLDGCASLQAGVAGSAHGSGGHGVYMDRVEDVTIRDLKVRDPSGHGFYAADQAKKIRIYTADFSAINEHSQLGQLNSEDGTGIFDVEVWDSAFAVRDKSTDVWNVLGACTREQPMQFIRCRLLGGRRGLVLDRAPGTSRPSFVDLHDCVVERPAFVGSNCILRLFGTSKLQAGATGPGKVTQG